MSRNYLPVAIFFLICSHLTTAEVSFTTAPSLVKEADHWIISFSLSEYSDVEVSIVDTVNSTVIKHLAAGLLGSNPPQPLAPNSLSQSLQWNLEDDFGNVVLQTSTLAARVRAGMKPELRAFGAEEDLTFINPVVGAGSGGTGMHLADDGTIFLMAYTTWRSIIRRYDAEGNYIRTVFPPPANLPEDSVALYGIHKPDGSNWIPKTVNSLKPTIANTLINSLSAYMIPSGKSGEMIITDGFNFQTISEGGAALSTEKPLFSSPTIRNTGSCGGVVAGPKYWTASHNPDYMYLSGMYECRNTSGCALESAVDTGFWADGHIYKLHVLTGTLTSWLKIDSIPTTASNRLTVLGSDHKSVSAIHGVTIAGNQHILVSDRLNKRVAVYDTSKTLVNSIPVDAPDLTAICKRTGALYVLTRHQTKGLSLLKFSGWSGSITKTDSIFLAPIAYPNISTKIATRPALIVTNKNNISYIWVSGYFGFRLYRDDNSGPVLHKDIGSSGKDSMLLNQEYILKRRMCVDSKTETVYWGVGTNFKVDNWNNPSGKYCYTVAPSFLPTNNGSRTAISGIDDITISPKGLVYGYYTGTNDREPLTSYNRAPIRRHTLPINTEIPYANTAKSIATCEIGYASSIFGNQHLGIAVSWQNEIAVHTNSWKEGTGIYIFPDTGYELPLADIANAHCRKVVGNLGSMSNSSGIKFDPAGNIYVGSTIKAPDRITIPGFENDEFSMNLFSGSIIKYAASDTNKSVVWSNKTTGTAVGALKVYPQAYGTFTGGGTSTNCCFCNSPRFDLDPYGRLYIPNSSTGKITIADNEGNTILTFGEYGNVDCRGGLPGSIGEIYSAPSIPIAWPVSVAATEDYIYVGDYINARIVRVQKIYSVDNMPDFTNSTRASIHHNSINKISMNSNPNPFNPSSVIFVATNQPCNITLAVYNSKGERIRDLAQSRLGQGVHKFLWNGTDNTGTSVAAGLYIYQLKAGKKVLHSKTIFAK